MLSINGKAAHPNMKGGFLAILPPGPRSVFNKQAEPLVDLVGWHDELTRLEQLRDRRGSYYKGVWAIKTDIVKARRGLMRCIRKHPAQVAALAELEGPVQPQQQQQQQQQQQPDKKRRRLGECKLSCLPLTRRRSKNNGGVGSGGGSGAQQQGQPPLSPPATLLQDHQDLASVIFDFLDKRSALCGFGSTNKALHDAAQAWLTHLAMTITSRRDAVLPSLVDRYPGLRHLELVIMGCFNSVQLWEPRLAARLETLGVTYSCHCRHRRDNDADPPCPLYTAPVFATLCGQEWPKLRTLKLGEHQLGPFLVAAQGKPHLVFPSLHTLATPVWSGDNARKLLALMDRGAFPALKVLAPHGSAGFGPIFGAGKAADDVARQWELAARLPGTDTLQLGRRAGEGPSWAGFTALLLNGGLAHLKRLRVEAGVQIANGGELVSLLRAIGSGAFPQLERLELALPHGPNFARIDGDDDDDDDGPALRAGSLPSLRALVIHNYAPDDFVGALFTMGGPHLAELTIKKGPVVTTALRLMAQQDYLWLPNLRLLHLEWTWTGGVRGWTLKSPEHLFAALPRLPALERLWVHCAAYDEIVVRLIALAENGGLAHLQELDLARDDMPDFSHGALPFDHRPYMHGLATACFAQIKEARAQLEVVG